MSHVDFQKCQFYMSLSLIYSRNDHVACLLYPCLMSNLRNISVALSLSPHVACQILINGHVALSILRVKGHNYFSRPQHGLVWKDLLHIYIYIYICICIYIYVYVYIYMYMYIYICIYIYIYVYIYIYICILYICILYICILYIYLYLYPYTYICYIYINILPICIHYHCHARSNVCLQSE